MSTPAKTQQPLPKITEEGLTDLRQRIASNHRYVEHPWNYEATDDAIRHKATIGDDNPL